MKYRAPHPGVFAKRVHKESKECESLWLLQGEAVLK
jgi:hypothetical protein